LFLLSVLSIPASAQIDNLRPYTTCNLGPDFEIVQVDGPKTDFAWPAPVKDGDRSIPVEEGYRVLVTYKQSEAFGNLKAERLPKALYVQAKNDLLTSLQFLASQPDMDPSVHDTTINSVPTSGVTRNKLEGGVLSVYMLFRDSDNIVVTMYLLNDEPATRKFSSLDEYKKIKDEFLEAYTRCAPPTGKSH